MKKIKKTAVLLLLFNRPEHTLKLIKQIKKYCPNRLYIHCDGPREKNYSDQKNCEKIKKIIEKKINWKCCKKIKIHKKNLGLRNSIISGIDFLFKYENKGIILEDSIIPTVQFFTFCDNLLLRYKYNKNISLISGWNPILNYQTNDSYIFSELPKIWGWATWKRTWLLYDRNLKMWPEKKKNKWMKNDLKKPFFFRFYWEKIFEDTYYNRTNTWDYNLVYSNWINNAISIVPKYNLVNNCDYNDKTTTTHINNFIVNIKKKNLKFPLIHPNKILVNKSYDNIFYKKFYNFKIFFFKIFFARLIKKILKL
jgi:hypothetical protein